MRRGMSKDVDCAWEVRMGQIALVALGGCRRGRTCLVRWRNWRLGELVGIGERRYGKGGIKIEELVE